MNTQGMGYVTGLVVHPDTRRAHELLYARTDVGGAYRFDASAQQWIPLLDMSGVAQRERYSVESLALDPHDPQLIYAATNGGVLRSGDQGRHWSDTGLHGVYVGGNDLFRGSSGERLAVDPAHRETLYYGTRRDGLWRKQGAAAWVRLSGLPVSTCARQGPACPDAGVTFVVFDPRERRGTAIYAGVYGSGVWYSADEGRSWQQIGFDNNPLRAAVATDGALYVSFGGSETDYRGPGAVRRYSDRRWTDITPGGHDVSYSGIDVDAHHPGIVMVTTNNADVYRSVDQGRTWSPIPIKYASQTSFFWRADWFRWGSAALIIDPNDPSGRHVWRTDGFAVSRSDGVTAKDVSWSTVMRGLEELVVASLRVTPWPGPSRLITAVGDAEGLVYDRAGATPRRKFDPGRTNVTMGTSIDYSARHPQVLAFVGWDETDPTTSLTGVSRDGGSSWTPFGSTVPGRAGIIALSASDPQTMVWSPKNNGPSGRSVPAQVTHDGGASWRPVRGLPANAFYRANEWWSGQNLASDRVDGRRFYYLSQDASGHVSFWSSADAGDTWTRSPAQLPDAPGWNTCPMVKTSPAVALEVWVSFCGEPKGRAPHPLYRSKDGGQTFSEVASFDIGYNVAFGRGLTRAQPAVYALGRAAGEGGDAVYQSLDDGASWHRISNPAQEQFGLATFMEGDLLQPNVIYVGTGGRGVLVGRGPSAALQKP